MAFFNCGHPMEAPHLYHRKDNNGAYCRTCKTARSRERREGIYRAPAAHPATRYSSYTISEKALAKRDDDYAIAMWAGSRELLRRIHDALKEKGA